MQSQRRTTFGGKRRVREVLSAALTFLLVLIGMAGIAAPANAAPIPSGKVSVTFENESAEGGPTEAWDWFKYTVNLNDLDGLAAGDTTVVGIDTTIFGGMQDTTLFLNSDGTSSAASQADTVAQMDVNGSAGTMTFTLTDYASTHTNVSAQGYITAEITSSINRGETQPITVTIDGVETPIGEVEVIDCGGEGQDPCPTVPTGAGKWGGDNGDGTGSVTIMTPVFENATGIKVVDTLTSGSQSINGVNWVRAYDCVNTWGDAGLLDGSNNCVSGNYAAATAVPDGDAGNSWILSTDLENAFLQLNLSMAFTGSGPWTDTATITKDGEEFTESATVRKYDAGGGGSGELVAVAPVAPVVNPAECTVEDQGSTVWETVTQPEDGNGITYDDVVVSDDHVATMTASPAEGYTLDISELGENWVLNEDGTATWTYELQSKYCDVVVVPVAPVVNPAECTVEDQGKTVWETVAQPKNGNGITYSDVTVDKDHVATLTATPADGYVLDGDALGEGWTLNDDGTATWTKQLTSKDCAAAPVVKPPTPGLAATGSTLPLGLAGGAAVLLLLAGLVTVAAAKRRHANQQ